MQRSIAALWVKDLARPCRWPCDSRNSVVKLPLWMPRYACNTSLHMLCCILPSVRLSTFLLGTGYVCTSPKLR